MVVLLRVARGLLWAFSVWYTVAAVSLLFLIRQSWAVADVSELMRAVQGILGVAGVAGIAANLLWRRRPALARRLAMSVSALTMLVIPPGVVCGPVMLFAFWRWRPASALPSAPPAVPVWRRAEMWSKVVLIAITVLGGPLALRALGARHELDHSGWIYPLLVLLLIGSVCVHEAGHAAFAAINRLRVDLFAIGPLFWVRLADGWRFVFRPKSFSLAWGGRVGCAAVDTEGLSKRIAWMVAGGPLASFALGLLGLAFSLALNGTRSPLLAELAAFTAAINFVSVLENLNPWTSRRSDGLQLLEIWRGGESLVTEFESAARAHLAFHTGVRFREAVAELDSRQPAPLRAVSDELASYYGALDRGDLSGAKVWLQRAAQSRTEAPVQPGSDLSLWEDAWFAATYEDDDSVARGRLTELQRQNQGLPVDPFVTLRAEAALCRAEGRLEKAVSCLEEAHQLLDTCLPTGWVALNRDLLAATAPPAATSLRAMHAAVGSSRSITTLELAHEPRG